MAHPRESLVRCLSGPAAVVAAPVVATATVVHPAWWWSARYDCQCTDEDVHERLADPWIWSVEAGRVAAVVDAAPWRAMLVAGATFAVTAVVAMRASFRSPGDPP